MKSMVQYLQHFKGFNRNVRLFFIGNVLFQIGLGVFMVVYNLYVQSIGYEPNMNGHIISITSIATVIALLPAGLFSDRVGRKPIFIIGAILGGVSLIIRSIVEGEISLLTSAFFTGFFSAFIQVTAIPFLAENSSSEQRIHLFSVNFAVTTFAQVIGNLSGGLISDLLQVTAGLTNLESLRVTLLSGCAVILAGIYPLFLIREQRESESSTTKTTISSLLHEDKGQLHLIFKFISTNLIIGIGAGLVIPYLNMYFSDRFHVSYSAIGLVVSLGQTATALAMVIGPWIVGRLGEVRSIVYLQLSSIPFLLLTGLTTNFTIAAIGFLIRQALMNAANPIISTMIMEHVTSRYKGLANSLGQMMFMLGWAVTGPVSTQFVTSYGTYWGYAINFIITAIIYLIGAIYFYLLFKGRGSATSRSLPTKKSATHSA